MDAFGNLSYEDAVLVHKSKLELEKEAGESLLHKSVHTPSRADIHMQCALPQAQHFLHSPTSHARIIPGEKFTFIPPFTCRHMQLLIPKAL